MNEWFTKMQYLSAVKMHILIELLILAVGRLEITKRLRFANIEDAYRSTCPYDIII